MHLKNKLVVVTGSTSVEEAADTVVFLASEKASAINGTAQRVEGGIIRSL